VRSGERTERRLRHYRIAHLSLPLDEPGYVGAMNGDGVCCCQRHQSDWDNESGNCQIGGAVGKYIGNSQGSELTDSKMRVCVKFEIGSFYYPKTLFRLSTP
jgi:hypothetical protein